jgi:hypothetical protein
MLVRWIIDQLPSLSEKQFMASNTGEDLFVSILIYYLSFLF